FFQAEDGIRDRTVTGVQTCALPIYHQFSIDLLCRRLSLFASINVVASQITLGISIPGQVDKIACSLQNAGINSLYSRRSSGGKEIGRASCRERGGREEVEAAVR